MFFFSRLNSLGLIGYEAKEIFSLGKDLGIEDKKMIEISTEIISEEYIFIFESVVSNFIDHESFSIKKGLSMLSLIKKDLESTSTENLTKLLTIHIWLLELCLNGMLLDFISTNSFLLECLICSLSFIDFLVIHKDKSNHVIDVYIQLCKAASLKISQDFLFSKLKQPSNVSIVNSILEYSISNVFNSENSTFVRNVVCLHYQLSELSSFFSSFIDCFRTVLLPLFYNGNFPFFLFFSLISNVFNVYNNRRDFQK
jgi:hypothetical protein